jgi:cobalt transporter subunit CbtA
MSLMRRVLLAALLAGGLSGAFAASVHQLATVPLILEAETYEHAAAHEHATAPTAQADMPASGVAAADHRHSEDESWTPETGLERAVYTLAADVLAGIGFALLLTSGMALRGDTIDWREGLFWGLAGFAAFTVAPGLGLPPDIPGAASGPMLARQLWWAATAAMTAGGLALLAFTRGKLTAAAAVALLVLPHLYGAPLPSAEADTAPAALARQFAVTATVASFLFWAALGAATGYFYGRLGRRAA